VDEQLVELILPRSNITSRWVILLVS